MFGILALGFTCLMIYTLVKNALIGKQLSKEDLYKGTIELIIPITPQSEFFLVPWQNSLNSFKLVPGLLKIHILIDGHHPSLNAWQELKQKLPYIEIHNFPMRPAHVEPVPWMLDQISYRIEGQVVVIGDPEIVPTEHAFTSIGKNVSERDFSYFVLPQTARQNIFGEVISVISPNLALASFFGLRKWRKALCHPLLSISQGWMAMPLQTFKDIDFKTIRLSSWKEAISRQWDEKKKNYHLAFGEKHLLRYYAEEPRALIFQLKDKWQSLWSKKEKRSFFIYLFILALWSFPIIFYFTHPFWSLASFFLLILYRFFSKIVFQESWLAIVLHLAGCAVWLGTFIWWIVTCLRSRYGSQARLQS